MVFRREKLRPIFTISLYLGILLLVGIKSGEKAHLSVKARDPLDGKNARGPGPWTLTPLKPKLVNYTGMGKKYVKIKVSGHFFNCLYLTNE